MPGNWDQKRRHDDASIADKADPAKKKEAEEKRDAEGAEVDERQQNRVQNQMGNQAVLSMMSDMAPGGGTDVEIEQLAKKPKPHEKDGVEHGGEDDGDPGPITIHDLAQSWNPGMRRVDDKPSFLDPMPEDELPPEDPQFLQRVGSADAIADDGLDGVLAPSAEVVRIALTPWVRAVGGWAAPDLASQIMRRLAAPPVPALQDPHGRVLLSRSRAAAIGSALLLDAPLVRRSGDAATATALSFALELSSRLHRVRAVEVIAEERRGRELPVALDIFRDQALMLSDRRHATRAATASGHDALERILVDLARYEGVESLVSEVAAPPPGEDSDDPLGLDTVLDEFTGGRPDPQEAQYEAAVQNAERVASAAARSRVLFAGLGVTIAEVAALRGEVPGDGLQAAMATFDRDVAACLQLLLEIARTAQRRAVPPVGLHAGLRRAAKSLERLRQRGNQGLVAAIWGVLPGDPELDAPVALVPDAVQAALSIGQPSNALPWLEAQPASLDRDTAQALVRAAAGALPPDLIEPVAALRARWRDEAPERHLGTALDVLLGAMSLFVGRIDDALAIAADLDVRGQTRRNGLWIAEAALLATEAHLAAGDLAAADERRLQGGILARRLGAHGALSLLARWRPPEPDDAGYPGDAPSPA